MQWMMQDCQNHHFKMICSGNGNLSFRLLEKIGALSHISWKLNYKFLKQFVKLWMSLSQHRQQHYLAWHYQNKFKLQLTHQNAGPLTDLIFVRLNIYYHPSTYNTSQLTLFVPYKNPWNNPNSVIQQHTFKLSPTCTYKQILLPISSQY